MTEQVSCTVAAQDLLPDFETIYHSDIEAELKRLLAKQRQQIAQLTADARTPDWEHFVQVLEDLSNELERFWAPVSHLDSVRDSEQLRAIVQNCLPELTAFETELTQSSELFEKFQQLRNSETFEQLSEPRRAVIEHALRDFRLAGVNLPEQRKTRLKEIKQALSKLSNAFSNNVLDATQAWALNIASEADLAGLPESARAMAKQYAEQAGVEGWRITLDVPSYLAFMTYADNANLRETLYRHYVTRASELFFDDGQAATNTEFDGRQWDNSEQMASILRLRQERAQLLGFDNYAELSLQTKMADSPQQVISFLEDLAARACPAAEKEMAELREFAAREFGVANLAPWDMAYYSEKLRQQRYAFSKEDVRCYFPLSRVLDGLFDIVGELFCVRFEAVETPHIWHQDARYYRIFDTQQQTLIGGFYLDLYARANKRGGAWMADCVSRRHTLQGLQKPIAFLTCNFAPPVAGQEALLTHDEVITLFHEFGHGLHHLLTEVDELSVAGIRGVAWDAVELPSQFLENWCWERAGLDRITRHYETGEALPDTLLNKMKQAKNFHSALAMLRQIEFSLFDMRLHMDATIDSAEKIQRELDAVRQQISVVETPTYHRFQHSFGHVFAGGYAAGYYSYKWAEVLSADAFARFEEEGVMNTDTGMQFRATVLANGSVKPALELFKAFRGREPQVDALLRHSGLAAA